MMTVKGDSMISESDTTTKMKMEQRRFKLSNGVEKTIFMCLMAFLAVFLFIGLPKLQAQSDATSISGNITDSTGAVIPHASVTIRNEATGAESSTTANEAGYYTITNLSAGNYTFTVKATGFENFIQTTNHVDPNIGTRINATLKVGSSSTTVTVAASANTIQTETAIVGQLITQQQVQSIQLNGRNPIYLVQLEPGVRRGTSMAAFGFGMDTDLVIDGSLPPSNGMTLDGAPMVRTRSNGTSIGVADVDSTSQVQLLSTSYPAEYGRASGAIIRIVPKSGTSEFHATTFEYLRNSFFNANTWTRKTSSSALISSHPADFRYNQFGFNVNGPLYIPHLDFNHGRDKLFFLYGEEWLRYRHGDTATGLVPTTLMRTGNFSELLSASNIFYGKAEQLVDPTTKLAISGNIITSGLSTNGLALLNAYPSPNATNSSYNWMEVAPHPENQRKDSVVIDYVPTDSQRLRFTLLSYAYNYVSPLAGNFDLTPQTGNRPNQIAVLHHTWTINPTTVNDVFVSASIDHSRVGIDTSSGKYDRTKYGIDYPYLYSSTDKQIPNKIPTIKISGFTTLDGLPYPGTSAGVIWDIGDNLTKVIGKHTLKFGVLYEHASENDYDQINVSSTQAGATNNQNGMFVFTDSRGSEPSTGVASANTALGLFDTYGEIGRDSYTVYLSDMYEYYAQDSWHVTPKLVIEFGLRHSFMEPYYAKWNNMSMFSPTDYVVSTAPTVSSSTGYVTGSNLYDGIVIPGTEFPASAKGHVADSILSSNSNLFHGYSRGYNPMVWTSYQPRLGVSYSLGDKTVIRLGAGRYIDRLGISDSVHLGGNPPFQPSGTVSYGSADNPGGVGTNNYPLNMTSYAYHFPAPEAWSWTLTAEQDLSKVGILTVSYVGRRGIHLQHIENINQLAAGTTYANVGINTDALRQYKGFSVIQQQTNAGRSIYHGLQANLRHRVTNGATIGVAYTLSKSLDNGSGHGEVMPNAYDPMEYYGPSSYDTRHTIVFNYVWDIQYGEHLSNPVLRTALKKWQVSGTMQFQSGAPQSVATSDDFAGVGPGSGAQLWKMSGPSKLYKKSSPNGSIAGAYWFDTSVFSKPADGTFAPRETRDQVYGPGFQSWNIAMQKSVSLGNKQNQVKFKAEAFNFINHPNLDSPNVTPTSSNFGKVTGKGSTFASDRQFQFSLRYQF
ncbi:MAG: carboxypeptidase regulatory-like domain-containing protein [Formivibrio sp.]|nr:carboxypeptidase regulatory-like domain-containing protein [Formivibrio sp.]